MARDSVANFLGIYLAALLIGIASSYPNSVPNSPDVCSKMIPGHGPRPQTTTSPYEIVLNKQSVKGGNNLQIVIQGKNGEKFRGFYIQARDQDGSPIGSFQGADEKEAFAHDCFNIKNNAIHHRNRNDKATVTIYWKAPEAFDGKVRVQATVVQDYETFWAGVQAAELVSVSCTRVDVIEKRTTQSSNFKTTPRILNYNPYSSLSPLSLWDSSNSSSEFLLSQPSEESSTAFRQRTLFGLLPSFDFHGGFHSMIASKAPSLKPESNAITDSYNTFPFPGTIPHSTPIFHRHDAQRLPPSGPGVAPHPTLEVGKNDLADRNHAYNFPKRPVNVNFSPQEDPYPFYPVTQTTHRNYDSFADINTNKINPLNTYPHLANIPPVHATKDYQYTHYSNKYPRKPFYASSKATSDPSYPNSGYFPKDILTKLTSFIPNIYNALSNNPMFTVNKEDSIESIWKPNTFPKLDTPFIPSSANVQMPKYGYLVYNPARNNPSFVIPAENEDEFVSKYIV